MPVLGLLMRFLDALAELAGRMAALFAAAMVLVTCHVVVSRYLFNSGSMAVQELVMYLNALVFVLGSGYALRHNAHVRVDIFYSKARPRTRAWINLLGSALLLLPVVGFLLWYCRDYVAAAWAIRERSPDTGGLPYIFLLKSLLLVLPVLLALQGLAELLRNFRILYLPLPGSDLHDSGEGGAP